jgi:hypothetical protein
MTFYSLAGIQMAVNGNNNAPEKLEPVEFGGNRQQFLLPASL